MYEVTHREEFDSGHRLKGYIGPCECLHGHRYFVEATVCGEVLDSLGMLFDFSNLKKAMRELVARWDHKTILNPEDQLRRELLTKELAIMQAGNPTAENMVAEFYQSLKPLLPAGIQLVKVRLYETPDNFVDYYE